MNEERTLTSRLATKALGIVVLLVAAYILLKVVIGLVMGVVWMVVIVLAVIAVIWAMSALRR
jgi:hypothetical protein